MTKVIINQPLMKVENISSFGLYDRPERDKNGNYENKQIISGYTMQGRYYEMRFKNNEIAKKVYNKLLNDAEKVEIKEYCILLVR